MPTLPHRSQILKQCQHCFKSEREVPLKCCQNCKRAHYCSPECQRAEWKDHKAKCREIRQSLETMKQTTSAAGISVAEAEKVSKTWVQLFRLHLSVTVLHALELQRDPSRVLTHVLHLKIIPHFTPDNVPKKTNDIRTAFRLSMQDTKVVTVQDTLNDSSSPYKPIIEGLIEQSRELRAQNHRAVGYPLVMLEIASCGLARIIPLGIEEDPGVPWDPHWKARLAEHMARGFIG